MPCFHPLVAWQLNDNSIVFAERSKNIKRELKLPCGGCVGCMLERSRQWAVRCMHESQMHENNSFVTLTFDDDHIPDDWSLDHGFFQKFMKRLRHGFSDVSYYMCGEYGETLSRPHFHACLFGVGFSDRKYWRTSDSGSKCYRSESLERLWPFGNCEIGDVTFESAAYVARYCVKKLVAPGAEWIVDPDTGEMFERKQEYTRMSLNPAIGVRWFEKYWKEVFPRDRVSVRGKDAVPPRYYKQLLDEMDNYLSDIVEQKRYEKMVRCLAADGPSLSSREIVAMARVTAFKRGVE